MHTTLRDKARSAIGAVALLIAAVAPLAAQVTPPPPGTPASQIQQMISSRGLQSLIQSRIASSGLSADQIRQRLASLGYDPTTLDPYLTGDTTNLPAQPSQGHMAAVQALGITALAPAAASPAAAVAGAPTPAVTPPAMPAPTPEERGEKLRVFGLDVFARSTTQFQPVTTGPVPDSYIVGPGDQLILVLTGDVENAYTLPVTREGVIVIPQVGQMSVNGLTLATLREQMFSRLAQYYSGLKRGPGATAHMLLTLGQLRTNQVFVTGEVAQPGTYLVSPVASVLNALYLAGGPTANGAFRDVQIVRSGHVAMHVDLYEYLLHGNNLDSVRLGPGDVIFVPIHGDHVSIRGEVNRPSIYELRRGENLFNLIRDAGGVTTPAQFRRARITRILPPDQRREPGVDRVVIDVDLAAMLGDSLHAPLLRAGDDVSVFPVRSEVRNLLTLSGAVWQDGTFQYRPGMRAWDLLRMGGGLTPDAYEPTAQIVRLNLADSTLSVIPFSLDTVAGGAPADNPALQEYDAVTVFSRTRFEPAHQIEVRGAVRSAGTQPRYAGMTLRDAILRAGGLVRDAYTGRAFISRREDDLSRRTIALTLTVDSLGIPLNTDTLADFDIVDVLGLPTLAGQFPVSISGEVRQPFDGEWQEGMTLRDAILRAGGLTTVADLTVEIARLVPPEQRTGGRSTNIMKVRVDSSYVVPDTAVRFYLGNRDSLVARVGADSSARLVLEAFDHVFVRRIPNLELPRTVSVVGEVVYPGRYTLESRSDRLRDVIQRAGGLKPTAYAEGFRLYRSGSLVNVELPGVLRSARNRDNVILQPGDSMVVPEYNPVVVVQGAVNAPSAVLYRPGADLDYYIHNAGGYAIDADGGRTSVRYANGSANVRSRVLLFFHISPEPGPGSVVTVPLVPVADRVNAQTTIANLAQILTAALTLVIVATKL